MPRKKKPPYERMIRTVVLMPFAMWQRVLALGVTQPRPQWGNQDPDIKRSHSLGVRRAIELAEPFIDAAIAKHTADAEAQHAKRAEWLAGADARWARAERRLEAAERAENRYKPPRKESSEI